MSVFVFIPLVMFRLYLIIYRKTQKVEKKWSYRDEYIANKNGNNKKIYIESLILRVQNNIFLTITAYIL